LRHFCLYLFCDTYLLRHLHDQTYEEIAAILSMPIGTVKTWLFRARPLLKERRLTQQDSSLIQVDESGERQSG
jgi:Sigma-70, region 4